MEELHLGEVNEKETTKKVELKLQSASSLLKYKARRERGNEFAKLKRLKQPFAGTGMVKLGHFKSETETRSVKVKTTTKELSSALLEKSNIGNLSNIETMEELCVAETSCEVMTCSKDIQEERRNLLHDEVQTMETISEAIVSSSESSTHHGRVRRSWKLRMLERADEWENSRQEFFEAFIISKAYLTKICCKCFIKLKFYTNCKNCYNVYCNVCDLKEHLNSPFHQRSLFSEHHSQVLLPTQFVNSDEGIISQDVSVPCVVPTMCPSCLKNGTFRIQPGLEKVAVITTEGRFDLQWAEFQCSYCMAVRSATHSDFVASGWWPGSPTTKSYLFSMDLLIMWKHISHKTPGTSERKFIETLGEISKLAGRSHVIDRLNFGMANRYFQHMDFMVEGEIRSRKLFSCKACGTKPLAIHIDGIMKLYRWVSAKGDNLLELFPDVGFVDDSKFQNHVEKINMVKPKVGKISKDTCGGATYKAGKSDALGRQSLSETGVVFCTCRHGYLLRAVDMLKGETYRHVHYLHDYAYRIGCKFICYDVVCKYWSFAEDISEAIDEFKFHTEHMDPFLSRWHGKTHAWYCQILFSGHWMKGAGLTTGESTEQTNSKMARYGSSTKHMGRSNRRDHLTLAMIYANTEKEERLAMLLKKSLTSAEKSADFYEREFDRLVNERKDKLLDVQKTIENKLREANAEMLQCLKDIKEIVRSGPPSPESLAGVQKLKVSLDEVKLLTEILEEAKKKLINDLDGDILLKLPEIQEQLKFEARNCQHKKISAKTPLSVSQRSLEGIHLIIKNIKNRISKDTDASKQRIELKKQMGKYVEKATKLVAIINTQLDGIIVTMDDCYRGVFPWQSAYDVSFQEKFNLIDAWMLATRSKEEISQVKEEMYTFESGLMNAKKKLEDEFEQYFRSETLLIRGKAFLILPEISRLGRLLNDCNRWFRSENNPSNCDRTDILDEDNDDCDETNSESSDHNNIDQGQISEDEVELSECESDDDNWEQVGETEVNKK